MMKTKIFLLAAFVSTGILATATASGNWSMQAERASANWPMHAARAMSIEEPLGLEREQLRSRFAHYKLPSASSLAREITLEIVSRESPVVAVTEIEPFEPDS